MRSSVPYLVVSPSSPLVSNAQRCLEVEFVCCTDRVRCCVGAVGQAQLQHQLKRDLSQRCTRKSVGVVVVVVVAVADETSVGEDVVRGLVRSRCLSVAGSLLAMAGKLIGLAEGRQVLTMSRTAKHLELAGAVEDHSAA
jgi:hypothetical protein